MFCALCRREVDVEPREPDEVDLCIEPDGAITAAYTIANSCAECGEPIEMGEVEIGVVPALAVVQHLQSPGLHVLQIEAEIEWAQHSRGRGKTLGAYYGVAGTFEVTCSECPAWQCQLPFAKSLPANRMVRC